MTSRPWVSAATALFMLALLVACGAGAKHAADAPAAADAKAADTKGADEKATDEKGTDEKADSDEDTVTLTADEVAHLGVKSSELTTAQHALEVAGYGVVLPRDALAAVISERSVAEAAVLQSRAALARERELAGTAGALSAEARQAAERQAVSDEAAAALARSRLSALLGDHPPWGESEAAVLEQLEQGKAKLVRATFPLGALDNAVPSRLRLRLLGNSAASWSAAPVWRAPADPTVPGRSVYALLRTEAVSDGDHVLALAAGSVIKAGIVVPLAAVVMHDGRYWCYVEHSPTSFTRVEFSADAPADDGYFVTTGLHAGDRIVTAGAGLLLARQTGKADDTD